MPIEPIRPRLYQPIEQLPAPEPEQFADEEQGQPEQESKPRWDWIGSPSRPEAQESSDGISDLFEIDSDDNTSDLVSVDIEKDIMDGNLDDLTEVSEEDILGDAETGQIPLEYKPDAPRTRNTTRYRRPVQRYTPPTSMGRSI